jgi:hypothetical protein
MCPSLVKDLTIFCPSSEKLGAIEGHLAKYGPVQGKSVHGVVKPMAKGCNEFNTMVRFSSLFPMVATEHHGKKTEKKGGSFKSTSVTPWLDFLLFFPWSPPGTM